MTRLWSGDPITVWLLAEAQPERFLWHGEIHPVAGIASRWRVDIEWWRIRIWRDYFKLYTSTGLLVVIYRDLDRDGWYLHRLYD